ncbi:putative membrane protein [Sphingobacterium paludis]|uniref:Putative membrane protein n=2 Tax=Sphingobacterium paludis TaxID=1476465 RepID=A0A4R7CXB7_9SPHI|nr:putative membrane protein [Sphingobacterium paludis]
MKRTIPILAIAATSYFVYACGNSANTEGRSDDSAYVAGPTSTGSDSTASVAAADIADTTFASKAAISGMAEVEFGQLALEKAQHARVKEFASMMVTDHGKANAELQEIAAADNLMLPTSLDAEHAEKRKELASKSGVEFDRAYVAAMVEGHEKTRDLMEQGKSSLTNEKLKGFAEKTTPIVLHHLELINTIKSEIK